MNDEELFETELKRLKPARPPEELMSRLEGELGWTRLRDSRVLHEGGRLNAPKAGFGWLRWLVPGTALAGAACLVALVLSRDATLAVKPVGGAAENSTV